MFGLTFNLSHAPSTAEHYKDIIRTFYEKVGDSFRFITRMTQTIWVFTNLVKISIQAALA